MMTPRTDDGWVHIPRDLVDHAAGRDPGDRSADDRAITAAMNANDVARRWGRHTPLPYATIRPRDERNGR